LRHHIENIGKRALEQSGKYRVNKNDEENFGSIVMAGLVRTGPGMTPSLVRADLTPGW
jgi:hypothetical protein